MVGTRSAVFAPLATPGLIIVDEEHDTSYKQEESPRYHGRDVAIMRGKFANALVVLGSATPSLESSYNAQQGRYAALTLTRRILDRPLAAVRVVNMREEFAEEGPDVILSRALRESMAARFERREQVLVLLNRRGYAAAVFCRQCGHTHRMPELQRVADRAPLDARVARALPLLQLRADRARSSASNCAAPYLEHVGFGTERVEAEIVASFPDARVGRVDRDTIRRRGSLAQILTRFARRELDVLVGTQMIAKGHDFPDVTLVGVISADVGLGHGGLSRRGAHVSAADAGCGTRGPRRAQAGEAIIQTLFPGHYSIRLATSQDYDAFFDKELEFRRAMRYPPIVAMINVVVRGKTLGAAIDGGGRSGAPDAGGAQRRVRRARARAGAAHAVARRAPRAVLPERHVSRGDAHGPEAGARGIPRDRADVRRRRRSDERACEAGLRTCGQTGRQDRVSLNVPPTLRCSGDPRSAPA